MPLCEFVDSRCRPIMACLCCLINLGARLQLRQSRSWTVRGASACDAGPVLPLIRRAAMA
jgi:hypothetical protein